MKNKVLTVSKYLFFLVLGVGLMIWASRDLKLSEVLAEAKTMNFSYFLVSAVGALAAHFSRAVRWRYLIRSFGYNPHIKNVFLSVLFMYFSNIIIPRSGEVARCGTLYKYEKIPVKNLLGTVVVERLFDLLTFALGFFLILVIQFDAVKSLYFGSKFPNILSSILNNRYWIMVLIVLGIAFLGVCYFTRKKWLGNKIVLKLIAFKNELVEGLKKVRALKEKRAFIGHTIFIWLMYFSMTYVCFYAYEPTANLGLRAGFTVFVAGSLGMIAPTNGGIGAWHYMVILALGIFGVEGKEASSIANVAFAAMTGTVIVFGAVSIVLLPFLNKDDKVKK